MIDDTPIRRAAYYCGGQASLARKIGVSPQVVQQWIAKNQTPPARVIAVERATGGRVTRSELRPDLYPIERAA